MKSRRANCSNLSLLIFQNEQFEHYSKVQLHNVSRAAPAPISHLIHPLLDFLRGKKSRFCVWIAPILSKIQRSLCTFSASPRAVVEIATWIQSSVAINFSKISWSNFEFDVKRKTFWMKIMGVMAISRKSILFSSRCDGILSHLEQNFVTWNVANSGRQTRILNFCRENQLICE